MQIKRGICRTVFLVSKYAIKVPTTRPYGRRGDRLWAWTRGVQANMSERQWSGQDGYAPVLWSLLGIVQVYPRCEPSGWPDNTPDEKYDEIIGYTPSAGDKKPENIGILNGKPVWLDYDMSWNGCPHV